MYKVGDKIRVTAVLMDIVHFGIIADTRRINVWSVPKQAYHIRAVNTGVIYVLYEEHIIKANKAEELLYF